jgi:hypothetical protein
VDEGTGAAKRQTSLKPGEQHGNLVTVRYVRRGGRNWWTCLCACGNEVVIRQDSLLRDNTHSCGCRNPSYQSPHGGRNSPTYQTWRAMRRRCNDKKYVSYPFYGAKGIKVCPEWNHPRTGFKRFLDDMGERPDGMTLDRRDVFGDYEPSNCRWATSEIQQKNKRAFFGRTAGRSGAEDAAEQAHWEDEERKYLEEHPEGTY